MSFPNRGEGGGPPLGKNSHIFPFFLQTSLSWADIMFPWEGLYENYSAHLICSENIHKLKTDILLSASKVHVKITLVVWNI